MGLLQAWLSVNTTDHLRPRAAETHKSVERWTTPNHGWVKANVDPAVFGLGWTCSALFRDVNGRFIGGFIQKTDYIFYPTILEALAIREVLSWLQDKKKSHFIVESDCL